MNKITEQECLITGASGFIGSYLYEFMKKYFRVFGTYMTESDFSKKDNFIKMDVADSLSVKKTINKIKPDIVIHLAGIKNVKFCEENKKKTFDINVNGTRNLIESVKGMDVKFIYLSTDFVFKGSKGNYKEDDITKPTTYYGKTKLMGERIVQEIDNHVICRTSGVYKHDKEFVKLVIDNLKNNKSTDAFVDVYNSPTYISNLCTMMLAAIKKDKNDIFHTAGSERINRFEFAKKIAETFGYDKNLILPAESGLFYSFKMPKDLSLSIKKTKKILGIPFYNVNEGLKLMKKDMEMI